MSPLLQILTNLANTTERFLPSFQSPQDFEALLFRYGWLVDLDETAFGGIQNFKDLGEAFIKLGEKVTEWIEDDDDVEVEEEESEEEQEDKDWKDYLKELYPLAKDVYKAILELKDMNNIEGSLLAPLDQQSFWDELPERLIEDTFTLTLQCHYPIAYGFLHLFGIIEYIEEEPVGEYRVNYTRTNIDWGRLGDLITGPADLFQEVYSWDKADQDFQWEKLLHTLERAFLANRFLMRYVLPRKSVVDPGGENDPKPFADYVNPDYMVQHGLHELHLPLIYGTSILDESFYNIGLAMMPVAKVGELGKAPQGLLITPILQGGLSHSFFITPEISLNLEAMVDGSNSAAVAIVPGSTEFIWNTPELGLSLGLSGAPHEPWIILGSADSHRLELHGFELALSVEGKVDDPEVKITFRATSPSPENRGIKAVIDMGESDDFINEAAETNKIEAGFDLEIEWSSKHGFRFGGSAAFDLQLYLNQKLGPIEISNFYLNLGKGPEMNGRDTAQLRTGLGIRGKLGPVRFFVENTGFALNIIPYKASDSNLANDPPALGMLDFDLSYAPPKGIGFVINVPAVKGGGYLEYDPEKGRYLGTAELTISDKITLKAIGIIDTQLPDGKSGYSFLLVITAEFQPIQLGFGFTLEGVGGIVGIHRSMKIEAIRDRIKGDPKSFDQVLFPTDPIANIKSIEASLDAMFPVAKDYYTFGLMGKLGWGSPKLIDIKVGLILTAPTYNIALIGTAISEITRTKEPENEGDEPDVTTLLRIRISFVAYYLPQKSLFGFDASLFDSEVLGLKLGGDVAMRLRGGNEPYFMLSVGGFYPDFEPPKGLGLPDLKRIEIYFKPDLIDIDVTAKFYCAITSNTVQFGASAEASYSAWGITIAGGIGFDALFQFRPLYFIASAWGYIIVDIWGFSGGLRVKGTIEGPYPIRFSLYVSVPILWWEADFSIPTFTIGSEAKEEKPAIDVFEILRETLQDNRNWKPLLPQRNNLLVALRDKYASIPEGEIVAEEEKELFFHPIGGLIIDQDKVPLNVTLERFGHNRPALHNRFSLQIKDGEQQDVSVENVRQFFAPAQYLELSKEEKLNRPSYEKMPSGIQIDAFNKVTSGAPLTMEVVYETPDETTGSDSINERTFEAWINNGSIAQSTLGKKQLQRQSQLASIQVEDDEYVITSQDSSISFTNITARTEAEAQQALQKIIEEDPELEDHLIVLPQYEIELS